MEVSLSPNPNSGRYPRWGYLDRHATNPYMPRALLVAIAAQVLLVGFLVTWRRLTPT